MAQVILEIPGLEGECQVLGHEKQIMCESLTHDMEIEIEQTANARRTVHIPKINNLSLERKWDHASPGLIKKILQASVDGVEWKVHCLKGLGEEGHQQKEFLTLVLRKPILSKHSLNVNEGDTTESLEINAVEIEWHYSLYDDLQKHKGNKSVGFNTLTGKVF